MSEHVIDRRPPAQRHITGLILAVALAAAGCWIAPATSTSPGPLASASLPTPALTPACRPSSSLSTATPSPIPVLAPTPSDIGALEDVLLRVSAMVEACPEIAEMDLNPVIVFPHGAVVVDARIRIEAS